MAETKVIRVKKETYKKITDCAKKDQRTIPAELDVLVVEAVEHREKQVK